MSELKKLGDLIDLIDERNKNGIIKTLIGVSIDKCFIKSVANTIGTDLSKYQIIRKFDFACSLMQVSRDGKIPIACLKDFDEAIMSPAYYIFKIKNTDEILPDYLAMWFMRSEFDREASYIAVGGVRGSMPWEDFCDMKLPVPPLEEQQKIVETCSNEYRELNNAIVLVKKPYGALVQYSKQKGDLFFKLYAFDSELAKVSPLEEDKGDERTKAMNMELYGTHLFVTADFDKEPQKAKKQSYTFSNITTNWIYLK